MDIKQRIIAQVQKYREIASAKGHHLPMIPIDFSLKGGVAGKMVHYRYSGQPIKFRFNLAIAERHPEAFLRRTVPHEIAHALQFMRNAKSKPHGHEWDYFCKLLTGSTMPRCHSYDVSGIKRTRKVKRYQYTCDCSHLRMITSIKHNRIQDGDTYCCTMCGSKIYQVI